MRPDFGTRQYRLILRLDAEMRRLQARWARLLTRKMRAYQAQRRRA